MKMGIKDNFSASVLMSFRNTYYYLHMLFSGYFWFLLKSVIMFPFAAERPGSRAEKCRPTFISICEGNI